MSLGLFVINAIVRYVYRQNPTAPCLTHFTSQIIAGDQIKIGKRVKRSFAQSGNCYLQAKNGIEIGDHTRFAPGVKMISADRYKLSHNVYHLAPAIKIGKKCIIGTNAIILPGVTLGDHVIVGAGAVVTKSFPGHVTLVGNPARVIN